MLMTMGPLMRRQLEEQALGLIAPGSGPAAGCVRLAPVGRPAARLVAWPGDESPGGTILSPLERARLRAGARADRSCGMGGDVVTRLVAAPDAAALSPHQPAPTLIQQTRRTAAAMGITITQLLGPGRGRSLVVARMELAWLGVVHYGLSLPQIGRILGDRDHTTILNARRRAALAFSDAGFSLTEALGLSSESRREILARELAKPMGAKPKGQGPHVRGRAE